MDDKRRSYIMKQILYLVKEDVTWISEIKQYLMEYENIPDMDIREALWNLFDFGMLELRTDLNRVRYVYG